MPRSDQSGNKDAVAQDAVAQNAAYLATPTPPERNRALDGSSTTVAISKLPDTVPSKPIDGLSAEKTERATEYGGQAGPEPTRYGDWEKNGRCTDF